MRAHVRVVVEQINPKLWTASFAEAPEISTGGKTLAQAVERLLLVVGNESLDMNEITEIVDARRPGHLEFRIPLLNRWAIPVPSVN